MKSLLISSVYFPPQCGGISSFMREVTSHFGPEQVCCLTGFPIKGSEDVLLNGGRVYRRPFAFDSPSLGRDKGGIWKILQPLYLCETIGEILLREKPDIVQLSTAYDGYLGLWLRKVFRLPFVVYAFGNEVVRAGSSPWTKPLVSYQEADRVLACSSFTASLLVKIGVPQRNIEIVYPGCDVGHYKPSVANLELRKELLQSSASGPIILSVGNLVARKGQDMVIRALPQISKRISDVTYLIVGDGPYRQSLESLAVTMGVEKRVIFAGKLGKEDLAAIYALCDVFAMPSRQEAENDVEGFGIVYLEANACGKAVIGGRSGGVPDAIVDGVTGILVDPHDVDDIAERISRLLLDRQLTACMGENGYKRVHEQFTWSHVCTRIQGILESVVQEVKQ